MLHLVPISLHYCCFAFLKFFLSGSGSGSTALPYANCLAVCRSCAGSCTSRACWTGRSSCRLSWRWWRSARIQRIRSSGCSCHPPQATLYHSCRKLVWRIVLFVLWIQFRPGKGQRKFNFVGQGTGIICSPKNVTKPWK